MESFLNPLRLKTPENYSPTAAASETIEKVDRRFKNGKIIGKRKLREPLNEQKCSNNSLTKEDAYRPQRAAANAARDKVKNSVAVGIYHKKPKPEGEKES